MTTALEMITDSLRLANVIDGNEVPDAEQGVTGLRSLNSMLKDWQADGIRIGWQTVAAVDDVLPLRDEDMRGVTYNLAVELSGSYGIDVPPRVEKIAADSYDRLAKTAIEYFEADMSGLPTAEPYIGFTFPND